ncbi:S41 family peptidase [Flavobacterium sp.]|uniref:S41 family peptidase n=1 Tax=Flavobacterium sp. TaxID=239 RepID=UPI0026075171|nr:S41 family peptidase [Flavobacterium sp.]
MTQTFRLLLVFIGILGISVSCTSVERYNKRIAQPIPVAQLQEDIDFIQKKLKRLYPHLHGYIAEQTLHHKFDSIRRVIQQPMTPKDFYFVIAPVIASVRQGHMSTSFPQLSLTRAQRKHLKGFGEGPLSQVTSEWIGGEMVVLKNKSEHKNIRPGASIVSINGITPQTLYAQYRPTLTSDGFNETYIRKGFGRRLPTYFTAEFGVRDSLQYVFKQNDSLYQLWVKRKPKPKPTKKTVQKAAKEIPTDSAVAAKKPEKSALKMRTLTRKERRIFGYDPTTKECAVSLKRSELDSTLYVLRIKNFSASSHRKAYPILFDSIRKMELNTLVLDLRDNPGGRVADAVNLYRYFIDQPFTLLQPAEVTSKTSLWKLGAISSMSPVAYPFFFVGYPFYMAFTYLRTTQSSKGDYQYKLTGSRPVTPASQAYTGKLYVLINGGSFSAACIESAGLKQRPNTHFVGEETGGAFNGTVAGIMPVVRLPHSKISVRLGLMHIQPVAQSESMGRGVFPDTTIIPTREDRVKARDVEMEWVVKDAARKYRL